MNQIIKDLSVRLQLDLEYFIRNGAILVGNQFVDTLLAFLSTIVFTRFLSKGELGIYTLVLSLLSIASVSSLPGMSQAVARATVLGYGGDISRATHQSVKYSLLGSGFLILCSIYYLFVHQIAYVPLLFLGATFLPLLYSFNNIWTGTLLGRKSFVLSALFGICLSGLNFLAVATAVILQQSLVIILLAYVMSLVTPNLIFYWFARKQIKSNKTSNETNNYGLFLTKTNFLNSLATQFDQVSLGLFLSPATVATYRISSSLTNSVKNLEKTAGNLVLPKMLEFEERTIRKRITQSMIFTSLASLAFILVCFLIQPWFVRFFFTDKYSDAIFPGQILIFSLVFVPLEIIFSQYFVAHKLVKEISLTTTIIPLAKMTLTIIFLFVWGFYGVIVSNLLSRAFNISLYLYLLLRSEGSFL